MSIAYRQGYKLGADFARKENPSVKLFKQLSTDYSVKLSEYDTIHSELTSAEDIGLHDSLMSEETDNKLVSLNRLRDDLIGLKAQLEVLNQI